MSDMSKKTSPLFRPVTHLRVALKQAGIGPVRATHTVYGKTTLVWYVDNDDDKYIELVDSLKSDSFVLVRRVENDVLATVLNSTPLILAWISEQLAYLSRPSPRNLA